MRYGHGHNPSGEETRFGKIPVWNKGRRRADTPSLASVPHPNLGKKFPADEIVRRTATRYARYGGHYVSELKQSKRPKPHPIYANRRHPTRAYAAGGFRWDLGQYFRSRWEANYARYLTKSGTTWTYEPGIFPLIMPDGSIISYRPDFLVDGTRYVELKGKIDEAAAVLSAAAAQLPLPLEVIGKKDYVRLEKTVAEFVKGWEFPGEPRPSDVPHLCPTCHQPTKRQTQKYCCRLCQLPPFTGRTHSPESLAKGWAKRRAKPCDSQQ